MAEVMFKLLRCDASASHLLGWAKKEVKRLIDHAGLEAFQRTWVHGDVTVRAHYFGGLARLWLEAAGTERLAVWATLPDPYPYRTLFTTTRSTSVPYMTVARTVEPWEWGSKLTEQYAIYDTFGVLQASWTGTQTPAYTDETRTTRTIALDRWVLVRPSNDGGHGTVTNFQGVPFVVFTLGTYEWVEVTGVGASYSSPTTPAYESLVYEVNKELAVVTSSAQVLATSPVVVVGSTYTYWHNTGLSAYCVPAYIADTSLPATTYIFSHLLEYTVPDDVVDMHVEADDVVPIIYQLDGKATVEAAWYAYRDAAVVRRKELFIAHTEQTLEALRAGTAVSVPWDYVMKARAPISAHVERTAAPSISYSDTFPEAGVTVRTTTLTYSYLGALGEEVFVEETFEGRVTTIDTLHALVPEGTTVATSRQSVFENWFVPPGPFSFWSVGAEAMLHAYLADNSFDAPFTGYARDMGLSWSGTLSSPAFFGYFADSSSGAEPTVAPRLDVSPPAPPYTNNMVGTLSPAMERWHTRTKQRYAQDVSTAAEQALCSSMLVPGMTVDVVLLAAVSGGVVLGAFAAPVDTPAVDAVEVYGVARYRWSGGGFVFKSWQGLPEEAQAARIPLPPGYVLEGNALLIYGGIKWDDVKETAKAQRKALADPNDPAHDPLMKAVLTALTPAE